MTLSLTIPSEVEDKLRERAAAKGTPVEEYASRVLAAAVSAPTLDELLAPARKQVAGSGMTDTSLDEFLNELRETASQHLVIGRLPGEIS